MSPPNKRQEHTNFPRNLRTGESTTRLSDQIADLLLSQTWKEKATANTEQLESQIERACLTLRSTAAIGNAIRPHNPIVFFCISLRKRIG